jgi:hypothetical protein
MTKINSGILLQGLQEDIRQLILQANYLQHKAPSLLEKRPSAEGWSVAQVLEHLNIYCRFYIPAIEIKLNHHQTAPEKDFTPGWLGNYFTKLMLPADRQRPVKKMKAPKNAIPSIQPAAAMLSEFLEHQHHLLNLLAMAAKTNLSQIRIPTALSKMIQLKLGDTFRFLIAHQQRHFIQIERTLPEAAK